jgi:predicted O-linked N-acetylglucosamine transferase (SPINDLY family)
MLYYFFQKIYKKINRTYQYLISIGVRLDKADEYFVAKDYRSAINEAEKYLRRDPHNARMYLFLANCHELLGEKDSALRYFKVAYTLDDTYVLAIFHWARMLVAAHRSEEALPLLALIKDDTTLAEAVDSTLSAICMDRGDAYRAKEFQLASWLSDFDNLRNANCYLFRLAYNDSEEMLVAQEHQFWAETLKPFEPATPNANTLTEATVPDTTITFRKKGAAVRIGYWGSDFRDHSVRYFARPLLENHNQTHFEVFIYSENFMNLPDDAHTTAYRAITKDYYDVFELSDDKVVDLIKSHDLDILVDITGHTSANRMNLFQQKLAKIQITGLAYPPTTGLQSIDVKLMDPHIWTPQADHYYVEDPLILPQSLWCFDPMEEVPLADQPPKLKNGYTTFACFGNIAKITPSVLQCWQKILQPDAKNRLVIQSTALVDPDTIKSFRQRLEVAGIDPKQTELRGPTFGESFWAVYKEVDVVLDTYPFNGGTTSCFAAYAGVPIVTLSGNSLISRVGRSLMCNLGYPELAVDNNDDYVKQAILIGSNSEFLSDFRKQAPLRFKSSSLGNGKKFTQEFEAACVQLLRQVEEAGLINHSQVPPLPAEVMVQRAQTVWYHGNFEAAQRIIDLCLKYYPDNEGANNFKIMECIHEGDYKKGMEVIQSNLQRLKSSVPSDTAILQTQLFVLLGQPDLARAALESIDNPEQCSVIQKLQVDLINALLFPAREVEHSLATEQSSMRFEVFVPCDSEAELQAIREQIQSVCDIPENWLVQYSMCQQKHRLSTYNEAIASTDADILIILQKNLQIYQPAFFKEIAATLESNTLMGCAGATKWRQKEWSLDASQYKSWGLIRPMRHGAEQCELQFAGNCRRKVVTGAVVLDGKFLAFKPEQVSGILFNEELADSQSLAEEEWSNRVFLAGHALCVHRNMGLFINQSMDAYTENSTQGKRIIIERLQFDPFALPVRDFTIITVPAKTPSNAVEIAGKFLI